MRLEKQKGSTVVWVVILAIVIILLLWWLLGGSAVDNDLPTDVAVEEIQDPEAASIASDLEGLDTVDLEVEFSDIETDLEQL